MKKFIFSIIALLGMLMPNNVWAEEIAGSEGTDYNEAYAVLVMSSGEDTGKSDAYLTLYYDNKKSEHNEGAVVDLDRLATSQEMLMNRQYLHSVLFDPSFADCRPTSTAYWFAGCFSLEAIDNLQYLNTSEVTDMTEMFNECPLEELDLSTFNTSKVTSFNRMFGMCRSLKVLNLSSWNTENCTDFEMMFNGCASLTTIYVGSYWSTASATDTSMFGGCTSLVGGNGTTFSQEHIGIDYAHIDRADQPGYFTYSESSGEKKEQVATPTFMFSGDQLFISSDTEDAKIFYATSSINGDGTTDANGTRAMTANDITYTEYTDPLFITSDTIIMAKAVKDGMEDSEVNTLTYYYSAWMELLNAMDYGNQIYKQSERNENVSQDLREQLSSLISRAEVCYYSDRATTDYHEVEKLTHHIMEYAKQIEEQMQTQQSGPEPYAVLSENNTVLTFYYDEQKEARGGMNVETISFVSNEDNQELTHTDSEWDSARDMITTVIFDDSFANDTTLESTALWFYDHKALKEIKGISNLKTDNVKSMWGMFSGCSSLISLDVSGFNTNNLTDMTQMFYGCSSLTSLDVSNFNTKNVTNMYNLFYGCSSLTSLNLTNFKTDNATSLFNMFRNCSSLTSIDVSNFNTANVTDMLGMFGHCTSLTSIDVSNFNTEKVTDMRYMFGDCESLITIFAERGWSTEKVDYGEQMFSNCIKLVGGAGTFFDSNHPDYTYAHIDGGPDNPGYFTQSGSEPYVGPKEQVVMPTFMFSGDQLFISSDTENAKILYATSSINGEGAIDANGTRADSTNVITFTEYTDPLSIMSDTIIMAKAVKDGMEDSEVNTLTYYYSAWMELLKAIDYGNQIYMQSERNENVSQDLREQLSSLITRAEVCYYSDRATTDYHEVEKLTHHIMEYAKQIEEQLNAKSEIEPYAVLSEDNNVLTFFYDDQKSTRNGMNTGPFNSFEDVSWYANRADISTVVFDSSFANYTQLSSTAYWFAGCEKLTTIDGISNLTAVNVTDLSYMFFNCSSLKEIDLSGFNNTEATISFENATLNADGYWCGNENGEKYESYGSDAYACSYAEQSVAFPVNYVPSWASWTGFGISNRTETSFASETRANDQFNNVTGTAKSGNNYCVVYTFDEIINFEQPVTLKGFWYTNNAWTVDAILNGDGMSPGKFDESDWLKCIVTVTKADGTTENVDIYLAKDGDYVKTWMYQDFSNLGKIKSMSFSFDGTKKNEWGLTTTPTYMCIDDIVIDREGISNMNKLFYNCSNLSTIYASEKWNTSAVIDGDSVFYDCKNLVGGAGTVYNADHIDHTYAHIDSGPQNPGYFTQIASELKTTYMEYVLTVEGQTTMAQALEQVGGREKVAKDIAAIVWNSSETLTRSDIESFGNPNLLIYVQTDSIAPEGVNNVVINGNAKSITLVDAESNNNFYAPMAFTAESISYTREFKQTTEKDVSRGWEGIALPFTVQKFTHESHGEIAPFGNDASIFHFWLHQMTDKGMVNATTIEANKPYIISMPNNGSYPEAYNQAGKVTFSAENVTVPVSDNTAIWTADGTIGMMSTYLRIEPSEYIYALNVGSTMESYAEGSVFVQNLREVKPFEVFTFHEENHHEGAGARFISVSSLFGGEGTTGIIDVMKNAEPNGETWYDLNGRRLQSKPSRKGVYIKNGKKVVVK